MWRLWWSQLLWCDMMWDTKFHNFCNVKSKISQYLWNLKFYNSCHTTAMVMPTVVMCIGNMIWNQKFHNSCQVNMMWNLKFHNSCKIILKFTTLIICVIRNFTILVKSEILQLLWYNGHGDADCGDVWWEHEVKSEIPQLLWCEHYVKSEISQLL